MSTATIFKEFTNVSFVPGHTFTWSPRKRVIIYDKNLLETNRGAMALLHEIGHAKLNHQTYNFDIELINMEVEAWAQARNLAKRHNVPIDESHIDECLETYRIWLYKRSRCPTCSNTSVQESTRKYRCFLCRTTWEVASTRTTQPRRMNCFNSI